MSSAEYLKGDAPGGTAVRHNFFAARCDRCGVKVANADQVCTLSGDSEHVYVTDESGHILSSHDDLETARAALRCACRGTGRLSPFTIDGEMPEQFVSCPWCPAHREGLIP